jgi:hypothetical protein
MPKVVVRWESAQPILETGVRTERELSKRLGTAAKEFYIISATGLPVMMGPMGGPRPPSQQGGTPGGPPQGAPPQGGAPGGPPQGTPPQSGAPAAMPKPPTDQERMAWLQKRLIDATVIRRGKEKEGTHPAKVGLYQTPEGMMILFLFPRTLEFSPDDKELTFQTSNGFLEVKSKFEMKNMLYQGKLAL